VNESKYEFWRHTAVVNLLNFQVVMGLYPKVGWNRDVYFKCCEFNLNRNIELLYFTDISSLLNSQVGWELFLRVDWNRGIYDIENV